MKTFARAIGAAVLAAFLAAGAARAQEGQGGADPLQKLKEILAKMEVVEKLLAKAQVQEAEARQAEIEKDLEAEVKAGKLGQDEIVDDVAKQLDVVVRRMKEIDEEIDKVIQSVKMSQSSGSGGMEMQDNPSKGSEEEKQQKRKEERERELKKLREKEQGGKEEKEGNQEESKPGEDPAKRSNNTRDGAGVPGAPRAEGTGRWGFLPLKEFREALASGKMAVPKKYEGLIARYLEMLAKKAAEENK